MKNRFRYSTLLLSLLFAGTAFGQEPKPQQIVWGTKEITWDDFKGPYNRKSSGIASTYSYMDMDILKKRRQIHRETPCGFLTWKNRGWFIRKKAY